MDNKYNNNSESNPIKRIIPTTVKLSHPALDELYSHDRGNTQMVSKFRVSDDDRIKKSHKKQNTPYSENLKDPRWQKLRLDVMNRDKFSCTLCNNKRLTLNVHHVKYIKGRKPWEYDPKELITVCQDCHELIHKFKEIKREIIPFKSRVVGIRSELGNRRIKYMFINNVSIFSFVQFISYDKENWSSSCLDISVEKAKDIVKLLNTFIKTNKNG